MKRYCDKCDEFVEYKVVNKKETYEVHGEKITVNANVAICLKCGNEMFHPELDNETLINVYNEYRKKHNMLLPKDIEHIRKQYGLSQKAFGRLLNFGDKTIYRYEKGSLQDDAHNTLMKYVSSPLNMEEYLNNHLTLMSDKEEKKLREKIEQLKEEEYKQIEEFFFDKAYDYKASIDSGNKKFDYIKFKNMVLYFINKNKGLLKTKLLKLLNYSDMYYFKDNEVSISGLRYVHYPYGPVPYKYDYLFGRLEDDGIYIDIKYDGQIEKHIVSSDHKYDKNSLSKEEIKILDKVDKKFKDYSSLDISNYSHNEKGYKDTKQDEFISYSYALDIE